MGNEENLKTTNLPGTGYFNHGCTPINTDREGEY
jgi:hypothetical protein